MSYYLIGIGGTGARCMEAFVHLTGAGLLKDNQSVKTIFVDADVSCGNLVRTQQTVDLYRKVRKLSFGPDGIFKNDIINSGFWSPVKKDCDTLDDVFQNTSLINKESTQSLGMLYESLFTEQERTTNLDKGFRGHPAIGAAVMTEKMNLGKLFCRKLMPIKMQRYFSSLPFLEVLAQLAFLRLPACCKKHCTKMEKATALLKSAVPSSYHISNFRRQMLPTVMKCRQKLRNLC